MSTIGILYPGEMGSAVARLLRECGVETVTCVEGRSARTRSQAEALGIDALPSLDEVVARAEVVLSLVNPGAAVAVAGSFAEAVTRTGRRPAFVDANSVSPTTIERIDGLVGAAGGVCVDGAFVGSSAALGAATTLLLSGPQAAEVGPVFATSFRVRVLTPVIGDASAFKLSFAGFNKGLVALYLEAMGVAERSGFRPALDETLHDFYAGSLSTIERLLPTYPRHASRRAEEMNELRAWLRGMGENGSMAAATQTVLEEFAALGMPIETEGDLRWLLDEYGRRHAARSQSDAGSKAQ
jgi:3-hydroxyisobutyrate dehydrogenase-like beta-hydroxyacid dehydrogenase